MFVLRSLCRLRRLAPWIFIAAQLLPLPVCAQNIDLKLEQKYFQEASAIYQKDGGRLWGASLSGPMLFADPGSRTVAANQSDGEGNLALSDGVFVGKLPQQINIANTAMTWAGVKWTMVMWPLPQDQALRAILITHELWHRIQENIGLPTANPLNAQLDTMEGRLWLQLEWRALRKGLEGGPKHRRAVEDALTFRAYRRRLFPHSARQEAALELNAGLAEYTGVKLAAGSNRNSAKYAVKEIDQAKDRPTFVRSFAYVSGPAYGIFLDEAAGDWRKNLKPGDDLGNMLARAISFQLPDDWKEKAEARSKFYGGEELRAAETARDTQRQKILAEYRSRFIEGSVLVIPLLKVNVQFNPNNLVPLVGLGTVYPTIRVSDVWGTLTVSRGALLADDWSKITISAPTNSGPESLEGEGWSLALQKGWTLAPGERSGDKILRQAP